MTLGDLIAAAYDLRPWQISGGPAWVGIQTDPMTLQAGARFDIVAKAEGEAERTIEEFRPMVRSLLAERFRLAVHKETRERRVYGLIIDKGGLRMHQSGPDARGVIRMTSYGKITAEGATVGKLIAWFSNTNGVDRPIVDRTALSGRYDFTLEWSIPRTAAAGDQAPDIFTAMPEQLGLRLVPQTAPVEYVVIDHAEMPSEN